MKNVLRERFGDIMNTIDQRNQFTKYSIKLPKPISLDLEFEQKQIQQSEEENKIGDRDLSYSYNYNYSPKNTDRKAIHMLRERNGIPMSKIARNLDFELQCWFQKLQFRVAAECVEKQTWASNDDVKVIDDGARNEDVACVANSNVVNKEISSPLSKLSLKASFRKSFPKLSSVTIGSKSNTQIVESISLEFFLTNKNISIETIRLADDIIGCFDQLFEKYISNSSQHCINIQSQTRNTLTSMYDKKWFKIWQSKQNLHYSNRSDNINNNTRLQVSDGDEQKGSATPSLNAPPEESNVGEDGRSKPANHNSSEVTFWDRIKYEAMKKNTMYNSNDINNIKNDQLRHNIELAVPERSQDVDNDGYDHLGTNLIETRLREHAAKHSAGGSRDGLKENELILWLLGQLIESMEPALLQVSNLMQDSFSRFKKTNIHEKAVELAEKEQAN